MAGGRYDRVRQARSGGFYRSEVLGLELQAEGWLLRFRDALLGRDLPTHSQTSRALPTAKQERDVAEQLAQSEAPKRVSAERERDEANRRTRELQARLRQFNSPLTIPEDVRATCGIRTDSVVACMKGTREPLSHVNRGAVIARSLARPEVVK